MMNWPAPTEKPLAYTADGGPLDGMVIPVSSHHGQVWIGVYANEQWIFPFKGGYARFGLEKPGTWKWYPS